MNKIYGLGSVVPVVGAGGRVRYRARVPDGAGGHHDVGRFDTEDEAWATLRGLAEKRAKGELAIGSGDTLREVGETFLEHREIIKGPRNMKTDRSRWTLHVLTAKFADWPIGNIAPVHVAEWIAALKKKRAAGRHAGKPISPQTLKHCVNLLHSCLEWARLRGKLDAHIPNPAAGHDLPPIDDDEGWTFLLPEEQDRLCGATEIPLVDRLPFAFAIGTGLRQGELYSLELRDVHADDEHPHIVVRYGKPRRGKTKTGRSVAWSCSVARSTPRAPGSPSFRGGARPTRSG